LKGLAIAATEADEGRHDLDPIWSAFVPKVKTLAPVRWFDQTDPRAPRKHRKPLHSYIYPTRRGTFNRRIATPRPTPVCRRSRAAYSVWCGRINHELYVVAWRRRNGQADPTPWHARRADPDPARRHRHRAAAAEL